MASGILILVRVSLIIMKATGVARKLHSNMFTRIIRAPVNLFFDRVPLGRLLNRFSSDLDVVDSAMPFCLAGLLFTPMNLIARFLVCGIAGTMWVFPFAVVFFYTGYKIQQKYLLVYREALRLSRDICD